MIRRRARKLCTKYCDEHDWGHRLLACVDSFEETFCDKKKLSNLLCARMNLRVFVLGIEFVLPSNSLAMVMVLLTYIFTDNLLRRFECLMESILNRFSNRISFSSRFTRRNTHENRRQILSAAIRWTAYSWSWPRGRIQELSVPYKASFDWRSALECNQRTSRNYWYEFYVLFNSNTIAPIWSFSFHHS